MPRTTTQGHGAITREEGTPRPGPPPAPRTAPQAMPAVARTQTPPAGVVAPSSSADTAIGPQGAGEPRSAPRGDAERGDDEVTNVALEEEPTSVRGTDAPPPEPTGVASVSLDALAAAVTAEEIPELEPSQSGDDLAIPIAAPERSFVVRSESEPVRLPEPPAAPAPLPPPPRPRTQPVPVAAPPHAAVVAPAAPVAPVVPSATIAAPSVAPVAAPSLAPGAPAAPRDERWTQTDSLPIVRPRRNGKLIAIIGAAVALVTVVIVIATRGSGSDAKQDPVVAKRDPAPAGSADEPRGRDPAGSDEGPDPGSGSAEDPAATDTTTSPSTGTPPTGTPPTGTPPTGTPPTGTTPTGRTPTGRPPTGTPPTGRTPTGRTPTIGKTAKPPVETTGVPKTGLSAETLAAARSAYEVGNSKLFAGDVSGAIAAYQRTVTLAPGYAAGYRGLGLAYAQQGNKAKALQALRTYLAAAPNAKDADLIRKRIAALSGG